MVIGDYANETIESVCGSGHIGGVNNESEIFSQRKSFYCFTLPTWLLRAYSIKKVTHVFVDHSIQGLESKGLADIPS